MKQVNKRYMKPKRKYARNLMHKAIRNYRKSIRGYMNVFDCNGERKIGHGNYNCYQNRRIRYIMFNSFIRNSEVSKRRRR